MRVKKIKVSYQVILSISIIFMSSCGRAGGTHWYKGNTHCHTLWSDGDAAPEVVAAFYSSHGYNFLAISDHNVLMRGEKWIAITEEGSGRLTRSRVEELKASYGADWVNEEVREGRPMMRLKTYDEIKSRFERPGEFLMIEGEEITDTAEDEPVHLNVFPAAELVEPRHGSTIVQALINNLLAGNGLAPVDGAAPLVHVNHPNFSWAFSWPELYACGCRFFELYNAHPSVHSDGDADHISCEEMWDRILAAQAKEAAEDESVRLLYAVGTDDAHNYWTDDPGRAIPGRAWVVVRAPELTSRALRAAYNRGDYYVSTGVELSSLRVTNRKLSLRIAGEEGIGYTVRFIGARPDSTGPAVSTVLLETRQNPAVYRFAGDELYVRATILSTRPHPFPNTPGEVERAWIQPVRPRSR